MASPLDPIIQIAAQSAIFSHNWPGRGRAPGGYTKGIALVFGRMLCKLRAGNAAATEMAKANSGDAAHDALAWYAGQFSALGMRNDVAGADTLRHLFALMMGLGMRESSGKHCEGRDQSATNTTAETAEAGLFQTSFNARSASPLMPALFSHYSANPSGFIEVFREGVNCSAASLANFGSGPGKDFQKLSKECPAFAAEFCAVGLRHMRKHWGPINRKEAELTRAADAMFMDVQRAIDATPSLATALVEPNA